MIARCYGDHVWEEFGLDDSSTVDISMNEKGKYHDVQEVREIEYSDERDEYGSDAEFANFREIKGGSLRDGMFYRSASPCNDQHCRAFYTDKLAEDNNIGLIINLSDNKEIYEDFCVQEGYKSDYYSMLYNDGKVLFMPINANYKSDDVAARIAESFMSMAKQKSPTLIHCLEGKDRTGFASALLLALAGASMQEIMDDYMISYDNYYGITEESDPVKYNAVLESFKSFIRYLCNAGEEDDLSNLDIKTGAEEYLKKGGLDPAQIKEIEDYITVEK